MTLWLSPAVGKRAAGRPCPFWRGLSRPMVVLTVSVAVAITQTALSPDPLPPTTKTVLPSGETATHRAASAYLELHRLLRNFHSRSSLLSRDVFKVGQWETTRGSRRLADSSFE
jgi:hypothetical protein